MTTDNAIDNGRVARTIAIASNQGASYFGRVARRLRPAR